MVPLIDIAAVMLAAGFLGGLVNHFIADPEREKPLPWWQHVLVGIAASFMVPLFLNMISADLIDKIRGVDNRAADYSKMFVLAGFCLVAAVSSRAFIRTLTDKVLADKAMKEARSASQEARQASTEARAASVLAAEAAAEADLAQQAVSPLVEDDEPLDVPEAAARTLSNAPAVPAALGEQEMAVLVAMKGSHFSLRSITGLSNDAGLDPSTTRDTVGRLMSKGLIGETLGKTGRARWFLTKAGRLLRGEA